ncbi:MAG: hypothetical protein J6B06_02945 [Lachnospiraceae bacterium]|nr:hypothetical protein [Lachnospiraceae bacterium]
MAQRTKKKTGKKKFTWINLAQLLTIAALLLWMQYAVDSGKILKVFLASPTSIVAEGIEIITDGTLWRRLLLGDYGHAQGSNFADAGALVRNRVSIEGIYYIFVSIFSDFI